MAHSLNPSTETEAGGSVRCRPAWSSEQVSARVTQKPCLKNKTKQTPKPPVKQKQKQKSQSTTHPQTRGGGREEKQELEKLLVG